MTITRITGITRTVHAIVLLLILLWTVDWSGGEKDSEEDAKDKSWPSGTMGKVDCHEHDPTNTSCGTSDEVQAPPKPSNFLFFGLNVSCHLDKLCSIPRRNNDKCHCDNECVLFGDCCADFYARKVSNISTNIMQTMKNPYKWYMENVKDFKHTDIFKTFMRDNKCTRFQNGTEDTAYRVISTCPKAHDNVDNEIRSGCESGTTHPVENIPVSLSINTPVQIVFKNNMCALCYGYKKSEVVSWTVSALCHEKILSSTEEDLIQTLKKECKFYLKPPSNVGEVRQCPLHHKALPLGCDKTEPEVDTTLATVCKAYMAPGFRLSLYKNPHCALCSNTNDSKYTCDAFHEGSFIPEHIQAKGLSILFNFNPTTGAWHSSEQTNCSQNKVWYPDKLGCHLLLCPKNYVPSYGKCVDDKFALYNDTNNVPLDFNGNREYNVTIDIGISGSNDSTALNVLHHMSQNLKTSDVEIITDFISIRSSQQESVYDERQKDYRVVVKPSTKAALNAVLDTVYQFIQVHPEIRAEISNMENKNALRCISANVTRYEESDLVFIDDSSHLYLRPKSSNVTISLDSTRFHLLIKTNKQPIFKFLGLCNDEGISLKCKLLSYTANEYEIENSTASINNINEIITDFDLLNDILYVCDNLTSVGTPEEVDLIIQILTVVSITVSIISLFALLVTYCIFPSLRTLQGKNLMAFSTSLLIAQSLFLFGSYVQGTLCVIIAISQHYFWLCTFTWTSTMAFDLASKFSAKTMMTSQTSASPFKKYVFVSNALPILVVIGCMVVDFSGRNDKLVGYGYFGDGFCWIRNSMASFLAFSLPVACCLFFNIICFGISLHGIQRTSKSSKTVRNKKQERNYCIIYTKISILLGGTWIVGLLAAGVNIKLFHYLNLFLNGSQGFFLFLGFAVNTRVIRMFRRKKMHTSSTMSLKSSGMTDITRNSSISTEQRY